MSAAPFGEIGAAQPIAIGAIASTWLAIRFALPISRLNHRISNTDNKGEDAMSRQGKLRLATSDITAILMSDS